MVDRMSCWYHADKRVVYEAMDCPMRPGSIFTWYANAGVAHTSCWEWRECFPRAVSEHERTQISH
eukprot:COSAG06_NODE_98_length_24155_cov_29.681784_7_plen_65_part_00